WMPVWWYPFSSIRWSPASTRVALVGALGWGRASALACSAMCDLLSRKNRPVDYNCQVVESKYSKCDRPTVSLDVMSLVASSGGYFLGHIPPRPAQEFNLNSA